MKKLFLPLFALIAMVLFSAESNAQSFEKGQLDLNAGVGLVPTFGVGGGLPLSVSGDYGINENVAIGGYLGYAKTSQDVLFLGKVSYSYLIVGARATYHKEFVKGIDTYGGLLLGYNIASVKIEKPIPGIPDPDPAAGFTYSLFAGARYHFTESVGVFGEIGYGISIINLGLTLKL